MATFEIQCSKNKSQQTVNIRQTDNADISSVSGIVVNVYTTDLVTPDSTYSLTSQEVSDMKSGGVVLTISDLTGANPADDFYFVELNADSGAFISNKAGFSITLEAEGRVLEKQGLVDVYSPDFRVEKVLMTAHILLFSMNAIEHQDPSKQKRVDFTSRLSVLKKIFNYE